jgi:hypothetical protein
MIPASQMFDPTKHGDQSPPRHRPQVSGAGICGAVAQKPEGKTGAQRRGLMSKHSLDGIGRRLVSRDPGR